jgi:hypothetical protein
VALGAVSETDTDLVTTVFVTACVVSISEP